MHPDWIWLLIGIVLGMWVVPMVMGAVRRKPVAPA